MASKNERFTRLSFTPGFSPVTLAGKGSWNRCRFTLLHKREFDHDPFSSELIKTVETVPSPWRLLITGLKPGVNERLDPSDRELSDF